MFSLKIKAALVTVAALVLALTAVGPLRAEMRKFQDFQAEVPTGWQVTQEESDTQDSSSTVVLTSADGALEVNIRVDVKKGEAKVLAEQLSELYSLAGETTPIKFGDDGRKIQGEDREGWIAFTSLGPDKVLAIIVNSAETPELTSFLASVKE